MNETKLKIIEMLDWEGLLDKELKSWCVIRRFETNMEFGKVSFKWYKYYSMVDDSRAIFWVDEYERPIATYFWDNCEIIWQYHLWHILQWFTNKRWYDTNINEVSWLSLYDIQNWRYFTARVLSDNLLIDLSKPLMERSEEQDKELLEFMQKIK